MTGNLGESLRQVCPEVLNPEFRHDFEVTWNCTNGNPNGDPDNEGKPRQLPDGRLFVTDACFKRMIRDYLEEVRDHNIYVSRRAKEAGGSLKSQSSAYPTVVQAIDHFYDIRMFGQVYLAKGAEETPSKGKKGKKEEEPEVQDEGVEQVDTCNAQILGPVQIEHGFTAEPVEVIPITVARILSEKSNSGTFGSKSMVESADITHEGRYSGYLGKKARVSEQDLLMLWEAMLNGPELRRSSMSGLRRTVSITIKTFHDPYGLAVSTKVIITPQGVARIV